MDLSILQTLQKTRVPNVPRVPNADVRRESITWEAKRQDTNENRHMSRRVPSGDGTQGTQSQTATCPAYAPSNGYTDQTVSEDGTQGTYGTREIGTVCTETAHWTWLVRYPNGAAFRCHFTPEQTRSQVKAAHPQAISVEPLPEQTEPMTPLHSKDERAVRGWLSAIRESDPELVSEYLDRCRRDSAALLYALGESSAGEAARPADRDLSDHMDWQRDKVAP